MGTYRKSRAIEASIIDYIKTEFQSDWGLDNVELTFARIYNIDMPSICIRVGDTSHDRAEVGDNSTIRTAEVLIDIFARTDSQRLDIKDWLIDKVKDGFIFYDYTIVNGAVQSKTTNGRIRVLNIIDTPINFDIEKDNLDPHDRHRHMITLSVSLGRIET